MTNLNKKIVVFIKPNFLNFREDILQMFKSLGLWTEIFQIEAVKKNLIEELYLEHQGQWYYQELIEYYEDKKIIVIFLSWPDLMNKVSKIVGDKDPLKADKDTIRRIFSRDSLEKANNEKRLINNVIHFQEDEKKMDAEVKMFENLRKDWFLNSL